MSYSYHNPNIWRRKIDKFDGLPSYYVRDNSFNCFEVFPFNKSPDALTKEAALRVSPSLVSLISYSGDEPMFWASGFIIESYHAHDTYFSTILTSASVLRVDALKNTLPDKFKIEVILRGGNLCPGDVVSFDWHFNIAAIRIQSHALLPSANLRCIDDSLQTDGTRLFQLRQHSNLLKLSPGDALFVLGRYHADPFRLMVAPTIFSVDRCGLDCGELLRLNGRITKCGIGGPIINPYGEVVGISFYAKDCTPFLPINVVCKWWEQVKGGRSYNQPWLGMQVNRLFAVTGDELEHILRKFPDLSKGIVVEEVTQDSPAVLAGICRNDIIVEFAGEDVQSCLELLEKTWDKAGKRVDLIVLRAREGAQLNLSMVVGGVDSDQYNRFGLGVPDRWAAANSKYLAMVLDRCALLQCCWCPRQRRSSGRAMNKPISAVVVNVLDNI